MVGCLCSEFGLFHRLSFRFLPQNRQRSGYNSKCPGPELTSNAVLADFFFRANIEVRQPRACTIVNGILTDGILYYITCCLYLNNL